MSMRSRAMITLELKVVFDESTSASPGDISYAGKAGIRGQKNISRSLKL